MSALTTFKDKAIQGKLKPALEELLQWTKLNRPTHTQEVEEYLANLNHYRKENNLGKITSEQFGCETMKILEGFLLLIGELGGKTQSGSSRFQPYHSLTCNRSEQMKQFESIYRQQLKEKTQFYYIYGLDLQAHEGIFNRIAYHLEGLLWDYLDPLLQKKTDAIKVKVPSIDVDNDLTIYKENLLKKLLRSFSIDPNMQNQLLDKKLDFIQENSPQVKGLTANDFVCVFLGITDRDWDKEHTPVMVDWFLNEFCNCTLAENGPVYLFFFGIIYEEDAGHVKTEVEQIAGKNERVLALPELGMVTEDHLKNWFEEYSKFFPKVRERKKMIKGALESLEEYKEGDCFFMEDIQEELTKIIDKINAVAP